MLIKEYRIVMPFTSEEYHLGQLYCQNEFDLLETGGGEGVEILRNEPFEDFPIHEGGQFTEGQYTKKLYHLASKIPTFIRMLTPKGQVELVEETWNAFPYIRTVISNPSCMKKGFGIIIESLHLEEDRAEQNNALELPPEKLKQRQVVNIDIAAELLHEKDYKEDEDPGKVRSNLLNRGPLTGNWAESHSPVMTCYKVITVDFKWLGLQGRVENFLQNGAQRLLTNFHRQMFCWGDRWIGMSSEDLREMEEKAKTELEKLRRTGVPRGMIVATD